MNIRIRIALTSLALLMATLACVTLMGGGQSSTASQPLVFEVTTPTPTPQPVASCPVITDDILELAFSENDPTGELILNDEVYLVTYQVLGEELTDPQYEDFSDQFQSLRDDMGTHRRVWEYFRTLIPVEQRSMLTEYVISTDGTDGLLAAVGQTETNPETWLLQVDIADTDDAHELTYTLIHEFGHLLTLGPAQVPPSLAVFNNPEDEDIYFEEASACPNYFPGEGCARADSYVDDFFNRFWSDLWDEWVEINYIEDEDDYYQALDEFYLKYEDQFVSDYAVTNPEEDIAETFSFFIFSPKPAGNAIWEEKILFFYDYPELVTLRESILNNVCAAFPIQ